MEDKTLEQAEAHLLYVSSSPHVHTDESTRRIMIDVCIALLPALVASVVIFGFSALLITAVCVVFAVLGEAAVEKIRGQELTISDFSAVVTGILLAFNLPAGFPLWKAAVAALFSIVVVKQLFGGLGQNFMNPALAGRVFLMAAWPSDLSATPYPFGIVPAGAGSGADAMTAATPLSHGPVPSLWNLFIGNVPGMLGEVSALALLIGAAYLLWRGVIRARIPVAMIGSFVVFTILFGAIQGNLNIGGVPAEVLSGGLILGALFMATDYTTTPVTLKGQLIFGIGCGFLTALIRHFGTLPEGVSYSILLMNIATPLIDKFVKNVPFGGTAR